MRCARIGHSAASVCMVGLLLLAPSGCQNGSSTSEQPVVPPTTTASSTPGGVVPPLEPAPEYYSRPLSEMESSLLTMLPDQAAAVRERKERRAAEAASEPLVFAPPESRTMEAWNQSYVDLRTMEATHYAEHSPDPPEAKAIGVKVMQQYVEIATGVRPVSESASILALGDEALAKGSTDPTLGIYLTRLRMSAGQIDDRAAHSRFLQLRDSLNGPAALPVHRFLVRAWCLHAMESWAKGHPTQATARRVAMDAAAKFLSEAGNPHSPEIRMALVESAMGARALPYPELQELLQACVATPGTDPWALHLLAARWYVESGWNARGTGYVDSVRPEAWATFYSALNAAERHATSAWVLHPEFPQPATLLIRIAMGQQEPEWEPEQWFHEAVLAQCDHEEAYRALFWAKMPRWGGTHEEILNIGRSCAESGRYDTAIPKQAMVAIRHVRTDLPQDLPLGLVQPIAGVARKLVEGYLAADPATRIPMARDLTDATSILIQAEEFDVARRMFENSNFSEIARLWPSDTRTQPEYCRAVCFAMDTPNRDNMLTVHRLLTLPQRQLPERQDLAELREMLASERTKNARPEAQEYYATADRMLEMLDRYVAGDWVELTFDRLLSNWIVRAAEFDVLDERSVRLGAADHNLVVYIEPLLRFAPPFDVEAELSLPESSHTGREAKGFGITVVSNDAKDPFGRTPQHVYVWREPGLAYGLSSHHVSTYVPTLMSPRKFLKSPREDGFVRLGVRVWDDAIETYHNGARVSAIHDMPFPAGDHLHFGSINTLTATHSVVYRNIRIRRIPFDSPPTNPAEDAAVDYYARALDWEPDCPDHRLRLANALLAAGQTPEARSQLEMAREAVGNMPEFHRVDGELRMAEGDYVAAKAAFQQALEFDPRSALVRLRMCWLLATAPEDSVRNAPEARSQIYGLESDLTHSDCQAALLMTEAAIRMEQRMFRDAREYLDQAEEIAESVEDRKRLGELRISLEAETPHRMAQPSEQLADSDNSA
ncbi:MAG: tetratricopeptide repeat protein [Planctomyces sp.]|nr:tetratricopeptide repeat protein [Planctomyces sp.]